MVTDPISNFIIALKNAAHVGKEQVRVPYSSLKHSIANVLEQEGFIASVVARGKKGGRMTLEVSIATNDAGPKFRDVKRISKPSKRVYYSLKDINPVRHGYGKLILSTPKGIMVGETARKEKVGGEALFEIW